VNKNNSTKLFTANGEIMKVEGEASVVLKNSEHISNTRALISPEMKHTVLVSWDDLKRLGIIPSSFPAVSASTSSFSSFRQKIYPSSTQFSVTDLALFPCKSLKCLFI
jgi:hypothetical protein